MKKIVLGLATTAGALLASVVSVGAQVIAVPTSTVGSLTANVANQFSDTGTLAIIVLAVSIPLFFYIVHLFMGLVPKARGRKQ